MHQFPDLANPRLEAKEIQVQRSGRACLSDRAWGVVDAGPRAKQWRKEKLAQPGE